MIAQHPAPCLDGPGGNGFGKNGIFHGVGRQNSQVLGAGMVVRGIQAVGVGKVGIFQPQRSGLVVHQLHKVRRIPAAKAGQGHGGIVAGGQHEPIQQLLDGQHLPLLQIHGGSLNAHRLFGDPIAAEHIALLADHQSRHDLGGAGNEGLLLLSPGEKRLPRRGIHHRGPPCGKGLGLYWQKQNGS